jgi:hypothetical protein
MCDRASVRKFWELTGLGTLQSQKTQYDYFSRPYTWFANSEDSRLFLELMLPYLFTKRKEALLALEFLELPHASKGGRGGSKQVQSKLERKRFSLWKKLRMAKSSNRSRLRKGESK